MNNKKKKPRDYSGHGTVGKHDNVTSLAYEMEEESKKIDD
jgi:hypothetical protein